MASPRLVVGLVLAASALAVASACSGTSTGSGTPGSSGSSGQTTSGGGSTNPVNKCGSSGSSTTSNCRNGELEAYSSCVQQKCDSQYQKCLGPNYQSGSFSGVCGAYFSCTNACSCEDSTCRSRCTLGSECQTCFAGFSTCQQGCTAPACASGTSSGTSGTSSGTSGTSSGTSGTSSGNCSALAACCAQITTPQIKDSCDQSRTASAGNEASCASYVSIYKTYCAP